MARSSLSQQERTRFARLLQGPLIPPLRSRKAPGWHNVLSVTTLKRHSMAHHREWAAGAATVVCLAILVVAAKLERGEGGVSIQLQALDQKGQLQIRWDPNCDPIRRAVAAKLYIVDGSERLFVKLDGARLRRGAVTYPRRSERVELRMALAESDGKQVEEQTTFVGESPSNTDEFQLETSGKPVGSPAASAGPAAAAGTAQPPDAASTVAASGQRARRKPLEQSGTALPFTCSAGDTFRKTDAPPGWDTFTCRGKNVWSIVPAQTRERRPASTPSPNATTLTPKPATASTT